MWTCLKCGREFTKQNQDHYCGKAPKTIDEYMAGQTLSKPSDVWYNEKNDEWEGKL